jgi:hypothetical protein
VTTEVKGHETTTSVVEAPPAEVDGSADMALRVEVSCSSACDLWGRTVKIIDQDGTVAQEAPLVSFDGAGSSTDEFLVKAPFEPGEYAWTAVFPAQDEEGVLHEESSAPFSFTIKDHATDIRVWDAPSSVAVGGKFGIKVGVECSSECSLAGQEVEVLDHNGASVATGSLGEEPWPETTALYWTEMEVAAPSTEGRFRWQARLPEPDLEVTHGEASCTFALAVAKKAECIVTIEVGAEDAETPLKKARVRLRPQIYRGSTYMAETGEDGAARLQVPAGMYQLYVWGDEHEKVVPSVKVEGDLTITVELSDELSSWRSFSR